MNKFIIPFFVFLITIFTSLALSPFEPLFGSASGLGDIYSRAPALIDSILYLVFFISLCLFSLEKVFSKGGEVNKYGKTIAVVLGIALAIAASIWSTVTGFNLANFGWLAGMLFIGFIFAAVFKIVKVLGGNNRKAEAVAYVIIYFCAFWVFPVVAELLAKIPWLTLIFSLLFVIALLYLFTSIFSKIKLAGGGSGCSGGGVSKPREKKPGWTSKAKLWFNKRGVSKVSDEIKSIENRFDRKEKRSIKEITDSINSLTKTGKQIIEVKDALSRLESSSDIDDNIRKEIDDLKKELDSLDADRTKLSLRISEELKELGDLEATKIKVYQEEYEHVKKSLDELIKGLEKEGNALSDDIGNISLPKGSNPELVEARKDILELLTSANSLLEEKKSKIDEINHKLLYVVGQENETRDKLKIAQTLWDKIKVDKEMTKDQLKVINELGEKFVEINFDETEQDKYISNVAKYIKGFEEELNKVKTDYFDKVRKSIGELNKAVSTPVEGVKEEKGKTSKTTKEESISKNEFAEKIRIGFETLGLINATIKFLKSSVVSEPEASKKGSISKEKFDDLNDKKDRYEKKLTEMQTSDSVNEKEVTELIQSIERLYTNCINLKKIHSE